MLGLLQHSAQRTVLTSTALAPSCFMPRLPMKGFSGSSEAMVPAAERGGKHNTPEMALYGTLDKFLVVKSG